MRAPPPRNAKERVHAALHRLGIDVIRYSPKNFFELRRRQLMERLGIDLVLDVGANAGQYAAELRHNGYDGNIISFEPVSDSFDALAREAAGDPRWTCMRVALGESDGRTRINVSRNSWSSSLLPISSRHLAHEPDSVYERTEEVSVARLDTVWPDLAGPEGRVFMKLDVQGFELPVLRGADRTLDRVQLVEVELSFVPLYEGQAIMEDVVAYLSGRGFTLVWLEPALGEERSSHLLQADGIFERRAIHDHVGNAVED